MAGLTPQEQAIMTMWDDQNLSMQQIATRLDVHPRTVSRSVSYYGTAAGARRDRASMTHGSTLLRCAIERARKPE